MTSTLTGICIRLYSILFDIVRLAVLPLVAGRAKREQWNIAERAAHPVIVREHRSRTVVWLHAASLGETNLLLRFIEILEQRNPDDCYVATATSRTGVENLRKMRRPSMYAVGFLPFDTLPLMRSLVKRFGISRLWLLETELWPSMLWVCLCAKIPIGIANARIEEKSFSNYWKLRLFFRPLLNRFDIVLAQNETYAARFRHLGVRPEAIHVVGNMKGHIRLHRTTGEEQKALRSAMNIGPEEVVVIAGCFHEGEGTVLCDALAKLRVNGRTVKCIVVPRKLDESTALSKELGQPIIRLTEPATTLAWSLCTVEKVGVLVSLYAIADAAIVGGTFVTIGGHNVWEAAQFSIPVFFGEHYETQTSGCETLMAGSVGFCVRNALELATGLERTLWLEHDKTETAQTLFAETINQRQNILEPLIP